MATFSNKKDPDYQRLRRRKVAQQARLRSRVSSRDNEKQIQMIQDIIASLMREA